MASQAAWRWPQSLHRQAASAASIAASTGGQRCLNRRRPALVVLADSACPLQATKGLAWPTFKGVKPYQEGVGGGCQTVKLSRDASSGSMLKDQDPHQEMQGCQNRTIDSQTYCPGSRSMAMDAGFHAEAWLAASLLRHEEDAGSG